MKIKQAFQPIADKSALVLILGSMPGEESLKRREYYAHPKNSFWQIMGNVFGFDYRMTYEKRTKALLKNRISVWDVLESCEREGSLDSSIKSDTIIENDFSWFFSEYPDITHIFFNGAKAEKEYQKRVIRNLPELKHKIIYHRLPSTSPAMARMSLTEKLSEWSRIKV
jgi:double-stranded uracil-DNA glycosylase